MQIQVLKQIRRQRRKHHIRHRVVGTADKPRMSVFRSHQNIYVQLIDDATGVTLCSASTRDKDQRGEVNYGGNKNAAGRIGQIIAKRAVEKGIQTVVFDRNGYKFHGRVKALADAAREAGLKF
ncbi:MAG: 50S ribosomal protein L18 [Phycisphaerae bacterium]|nr:50S ribosomal protein L18 [Phycisphaerae bacterium]